MTEVADPSTDQFRTVLFSAHVSDTVQNVVDGTPSFNGALVYPEPDWDASGTAGIILVISSMQPIPSSNMRHQNDLAAIRVQALRDGARVEHVAISDYSKEYRTKHVPTLSAEEEALWRAGSFVSPDDTYGTLDYGQPVGDEVSFGTLGVRVW